MSEEHQSKMTEIPVGVYYDKTRRVALAGHQGGIILGVMLGPLGVLAADEVNKDIGEEKLQAYAEDHESDVVMNLAQAALIRELSGLDVESATQALNVAPFVILTADNEDQAPQNDVRS